MFIIGLFITVKIWINLDAHQWMNRKNVVNIHNKK
jgi:hypothetical protein